MARAKRDSTTETSEDATIFLGELITLVAQRSGVPKYLAERILRSFATTVYDALSQGKAIQWFGFGRFDVIYRRPRTIPHPADPTQTTVVGGFAPRFRAGAAMRRVVNNYEQSLGDDMTGDASSAHYRKDRGAEEISREEA